MRHGYEMAEDSGFHNPWQPVQMPEETPSQVADGGSAQCVPPGIELLEFALPVCPPDASTPRAPSCDAGAGCDDAQPPIDPPVRDAGVTEPPEPSACFNIPVRHQAPSCAEPFWDTGTIECSVAEGELHISGSLCESCGEDRSQMYLNELFFVFSDCEGCVITVAAWQVAGGDNAFAANECKTSLDLRGEITQSIAAIMNGPNRGPETGTPLECVRVHVLTHFSEQPDCDVDCQLESRAMPAGSGLPGAFACECDLTLGTCAR